MQFAPLGDRAVMITLGTTIDEETHRRVRAVCARLDERPIAGMIECVPAFASVAVHYDPVASSYQRFVERLGETLSRLPDERVVASRTVEIPVCYGGEFGPDLEDVARRHSLTVDEVVHTHIEGDYLVYMVGFLPGFAYLGGLSSRIATARRPVPRTVVPAGSVGIGGNQTGVYPIPSPGGWNLIGRSPLALFSPTREPPTLLKAGDRVRFVSITADEYRSWDRGT
jgi:inhibitor of KinA